MECNNAPLNVIFASPAQIVMGRRLKTSLIVNGKLLKPKSYLCELIRHKLEKKSIKLKDEL